MKITVTEFKNIVHEAYKEGFFDEVSEETLNDDSAMNQLLKNFLSELRKKKVIRGKKLVKKVVCPKNKRYVPALKSVLLNPRARSKEKERQ